MPPPSWRSMEYPLPDAISSIFRQAPSTRPLPPLPPCGNNGKGTALQENILKFAVRLRHDILVRIIKPVTLTVRQLVHGLCIQLIVVYGTRGINHPLHLNADEAAAARRIGQQILVVTGGNERRIAAHLHHRCAVRPARIHHRLLQDVLQESLLCGAKGRSLRKHR